MIRFVLIVIFALAVFGSPDKRPKRERLTAQIEAQIEVLEDQLAEIEELDMDDDDDTALEFDGPPTPDDLDDLMFQIEMQMEMDDARDD